MYDAPFTARRQGKAAALEYPKHWRVLGQHFGDERLEPVRARNFDQVADQVRGDAQSLMRVVDRKRHFGTTRLRDDIPCATHDHLSSAFAQHSHQRHVAGQVYIEEEFDLAFAEAALWRKEAAVQRLLAESSYGGKHFGTIAGQQRADLQRRPVTQAVVSWSYFKIGLVGFTLPAAVLGCGAAVIWVVSRRR